MTIDSARQSRGECPAPEQLAQYLERRLDSRERAAVEGHLLTCANCRAVLVNAAADLDEESPRAEGKLWSAAVPVKRTTRGIFVIGALAAAAALIVAIRVVPWNVASPTAVGTGSQTTLVSLEADNEIALARLAPTDASPVRETLHTLKLDVPPSAGALIGRRDPLRSPGNPALPRLLDPLGTAVSSVRPAFVWTPVAGAEYEVTVFDASAGAVEQSGWTDDSRWAGSRDLDRGAVYSWQLAVRRGTTTDRIPGLAEPAARFRVLSSDEASRVAASREQASGAPMVLGILAVRAGLLSEAESLFAEARTRYPTSDTPRQLLESLRTARSQDGSR